MIVTPEKAAGLTSYIFEGEEEESELEEYDEVYSMTSPSALDETQDPVLEDLSETSSDPSQVGIQATPQALEPGNTHERIRVEASKPAIGGSKSMVH